MAHGMKCSSPTGLRSRRCPRALAPASAVGRAAHGVRGKACSRSLPAIVAQPPRPAPGHLPGRDRRRALPVLAPPVQPRRGERAQPGRHGAGSSRRRGSPLGPRATGPAGRCGSGAGDARTGQACPATPPHPRPTGAHVTHCGLQRAGSQRQIERILFAPRGQHSESQAVGAGRALAALVPKSSEVGSI